MDVRRLATVLYFTDFALLSRRQSGYRPGHNTQLQLMYLTDKRYDSLDKERDLTTIYLDIISFFTQKKMERRTFGKMWKRIWTSWYFLKMLRSYLTDSRQIVSFKNVTPETLTLDAGVPQGSVLGPLLTILYLTLLLAGARGFSLWRSVASAPPPHGI